MISAGIGLIKLIPIPSTKLGDYSFAADEDQYRYLRCIDKHDFHRMIVNDTLTDMDTLDGMKTVIAVVETGSLTAASERLGMSKALVSKYLGEVESNLGVRLFNRSTRKLAITEAGSRYYESALPLLEEFSELVDRVSGDESNPRGLLRISAPVTFGEMTLSRLLPKFQRLYPDIRIDLQLSYLTSGQNVPRDIEEACSRRLAELIFPSER